MWQEPTEWTRTCQSCPNQCQHQNLMFSANRRCAWRTGLRGASLGAASQASSCFQSSAKKSSTGRGPARWLLHAACAGLRLCGAARAAARARSQAAPRQQTPKGAGSLSSARSARWRRARGARCRPPLCGVQLADARTRGQVPREAADAEAPVVPRVQAHRHLRPRGAQCARSDLLPAAQEPRRHRSHAPALPASPGELASGLRVCCANRGECGRVWKRYAHVRFATRSPVLKSAY
eukprot:2824726-Rhodomonas_salina.1